MTAFSDEESLKAQSDESGCSGLLTGIALNATTHRRFHARTALRSDGPFYCPECFSDVVIRKCVDKIDHFAHVARLSPVLSPGESELHLQCKTEICKTLALEFPNGRWEIERPIPENSKHKIPRLIPDISGRIGDIRLAVEVQLSTLSLSAIIKRTTAYASRGIAVLWVVPLRFELGIEPFRPRQFEKYLHSMYYGRVYYWWPELGTAIAPVHFTRTKREIPYAEWYEADGEHCEAGGYEKTYKTIKRPDYGRLLSISKDFLADKRDEFRPDNEKKVVPSCLIWQDILAPWWAEEIVLIEGLPNAPNRSM
ncbi:competence protein CoiA [Herbaspirillum huttiense]|uniref:competence protein CoiA n=1 Tax=Herbaspirillum huttiense TaxID=863372 RepID=UPI002E76E4E0|nr:competence protein CoiA family protein [Herbaspirillum huttiense]MEE1639741.1 competence protein CoiA family protein [Herbaspirillum huttiense NC40101]